MNELKEKMPHQRFMDDFCEEIIIITDIWSEIDHFEDE